MCYIQSEIRASNQVSLKRDPSIDILRAIALVCIIIAHCQPSYMLKNIRTFDVPLIVFLSGVSFSLSSSYYKSYLKYLKKRFIRLIVPTWIFLGLYYLLLITTHFVFSHEFSLYPLSEVLSRFTLQTQWYVWIIRVFFCIALVAPFIETFYSKINVGIAILITLVGILSIDFISGFSDNEYFYYFCITYPYVFVYGLGIWANSNREKRDIYLCFIFFLFFFIVTSVLYSKDYSLCFCPDIYKYPPKLPYITYGLVVVFFLWAIRKYIWKALSFLNIDRFVQYIGTHSIWIYFYHIVVMTFYSPFNSLEYLSEGGGKMLIVTIISIALAYSQEKIISLLCKSNIKDSSKRLLRSIFIG